METTIEKIPQHLHLSALTQYFIPFGNYIFPILFWSSKALNLWITTETSSKFSVEFIIVFFSACFLMLFLHFNHTFNNVPFEGWLMITILF
jgi:uncharacterized Tic20 family protein